LFASLPLDGFLVALLHFSLFVTYPSSEVFWPFRRQLFFFLFFLSVIVHMPSIPLVSFYRPGTFFFSPFSLSWLVAAPPFDVRLFFRLLTWRHVRFAQKVEQCTLWKGEHNKQHQLQTVVDSSDITSSTLLSYSSFIRCSCVLHVSICMLTQADSYSWYTLNDAMIMTCTLLRRSFLDLASILSLLPLSVCS